MKKDLILPENDNIVDFKARPKLELVTGGGGGATENWLKDLPEGCIFLAKVKGQSRNLESLVLNEYLLVEQRPITSRLFWSLPDGKQVKVNVVSLEFSRLLDLVEVLGQIDLDSIVHEEDIDDKGTL